jgi:hypothetical protein
MNDENELCQKCNVCGFEIRPTISKSCFKSQYIQTQDKTAELKEKLNVKNKVTLNYEFTK